VLLCTSARTIFVLLRPNCASPSLDEAAVLVSRPTPRPLRPRQRLLALAPAPAPAPAAGYHNRAFPKRSWVGSGAARELRPTNGSEGGFHARRSDSRINLLLNDERSWNQRP